MGAFVDIHWSLDMAWPIYFYNSALSKCVYISGCRGSRRAKMPAEDGRSRIRSRSQSQEFIHGPLRRPQYNKISILGGVYLFRLHDIH